MNKEKQTFYNPSTSEDSVVEEDQPAEELTAGEKKQGEKAGLLNDFYPPSEEDEISDEDDQPEKELTAGVQSAGDVPSAGEPSGESADDELLEY